MGDPTAVEDRDGDATIEERAAEGEGELEAPEPPMEFGGQLSLNIGGIVRDRNARKVEEATISLGSAERSIDGLLDVDTEYDLLVRVLPAGPLAVPVRDPNTRKTRAFKMRQHAAVLSVRRADDAEAIRELFADLLGREAEGAAALLDELREFVSEELKAAA